MYIIILGPQLTSSNLYQNAKLYDVDKTTTTHQADIQETDQHNKEMMNIIAATVIF